MPYECYDLPTHRMYVGSVFVPIVESEKPIRVDGDLICDTLIAPEIVIANGSLICPDIRVYDILHADILSVYDTKRAYTLPNQWSCRWLRPMVPGLTTPHAAMTNAESIANVATIMRNHDIVGDVHTVAEPFLFRAQQRPSCGRARVLIAAAIEALWEYHDHLPPLGYQFVQRAVSEPHLPANWRF